VFDDDLDDVADRLDALRGPRTSCGLLGDGDPVGVLAGTPDGGGSPVQRSGDEGNRTPNPRLAKAVLCQLSYVPGAVPGQDRDPGFSVRWEC
jgi:hypothetical protein